ncbi:hypothetical protein SNE40_004700 [Patella caerulea]|uniref:C2 domain-containing protein n=1 Tax=Patella caerulea TaxID=87958 RepID=A0AAN8Q5U2_PATCE
MGRLKKKASSSTSVKERGVCTRVSDDDMKKLWMTQYGNRRLSSSMSHLTEQERLDDRILNISPAESIEHSPFKSNHCMHESMYHKLASGKQKQTKTNPSNTSKQNPSPGQSGKLYLSKSNSSVDIEKKVPRTIHQTENGQDCHDEHMDDDDEDIDLYVSQYNSSSLDPGKTDSEPNLNMRTDGSDFLFIRNMAEVEINWNHITNILEIHLQGTNMTSVDINSKTKKKVFVSFTYLPGKLQYQKTKAVPWQRDIFWDEKVQFKRLTMRQLETGIIRIKICIPTKLGLSKKCIARTHIHMKRCDYRKSHTKQLILETD